jgi:DNA-binding HxlR family transcriptional regulator
MDAATRDQFSASAKAANAFSLACLGFLQKKAPAQQAAWLKTSLAGARNVFQPWNLELLYVLAAMGRARFGQLSTLMGLSSRTLSDKLKLLRDAHLIDREIFDEQPVRIEYYLTKSGKKVAALASPLLAHLGQEALRVAGRL